MNTLELTKKLISIPSYVGDNCNEKKIADFLANYLNKFSWMQVIKQQVDGNRYNIILKDKYPTKLLIAGHLDTVQPRAGWKINPFKPVQKNNKLYGLGASDMKGNIAALLSALEKFQQTAGLMVLFYIDEEYNFLGMSKFIAKYQNKITPELIISADGTNLSIGNSCRGLIEIEFTVKGKTGHAAKPETGNNAIIGTYKIIDGLLKSLKRYSSFLGKTTCNVAFIQGGLDLGNGKVGSEGNNIADISKVILDIRPTSSKLKALTLIEILKSQAIKFNLKIKETVINHDLGCWVTSKSSLKKLERIVSKSTGIKYLDPNNIGYIDVQMLWQTFNQVPCVTFGAASLGVAHQTNEYVKPTAINSTETIYRSLIKNYAKGVFYDRV